MNDQNKAEFNSSMTRRNFVKLTGGSVVGAVLLSSVPSIIPSSERGLAYAEEQSKTMIEGVSVGGSTANSVDDLFNGVLLLQSGPELSDLSLSVGDGSIHIKGSLLHNGESTEIDSSGYFYVNQETPNTVSPNDLILAEMSDFGSFHFVQFRIEKDRGDALIILQETATLEIMKFEVPIPESLFDELLYQFNNTLTDDDLETKIINLYSVSGNLIGGSEPCGELVAGPFTSSTDDSDIQTTAGTFAGWRDLIATLNSKGTAKAGSFAVDKSFFTANTWRYEAAFVPDGYVLAVLSSANGPSEYICQFGLMDVIRTTSTVPKVEHRVGIEMSYNGGVTAVYNKNTDTFTVRFTQRGIRFNNVKVSLYEPTNNAVFTQRTVDRAYQTQGNFVRAAIALCSPVASFADAWDHLMPYESQKTTEVRLYDDTFEKQKSRYGGSVIRSIVANTEAEYLSAKGHHLTMTGIITLYASQGSTYKTMMGYAPASDV